MRLISHLTDRRVPCLNAIKASGWKLGDNAVSMLDELDRHSRAKARRDGHSHVLADRPALRANGKFLGHRR